MSTNPPPETIEKPVAAVELRDEKTVIQNQDSSHDDFYLDWLERYLIAGFYCWFVVRLLDNFLDEGNISNLFMIPSETLVLVFLLIRHSSKVVTREPRAWVLAFAASIAPLLVAPAREKDLVPVAVGGVAMILGLILQLHAKFNLARSFGCVPAHRGLKFGGPYRMVRHPMYAGYLLGYLGFLSLNPSLWNLAVYSVCLGLMLPRMVLEERLLSVDPDYRDYQTQVRYRLVPGIF